MLFLPLLSEFIQLFAKPFRMPMKARRVTIMPVANGGIGCNHFSFRTAVGCVRITRGLLYLRIGQVLGQQGGR